MPAFLSPVNMSFADAARMAARVLEASASQMLDGVAPPGWEKSIKRMKKDKGISNPFALAWYMRNRGAHPAKDDEEADTSFDASLLYAQRQLDATGLPHDCLAAARGEMWAQAQLMGGQMIYQESAHL